MKRSSDLSLGSTFQDDPIQKKKKQIPSLIKSIKHTRIVFISFWIPSLLIQNRLIHWLTPFIWENNISTMGGNEGGGFSIISSTDGIGITGDDGISSSVWTSTSRVFVDGGVTNKVESTL